MLKRRIPHLMMSRWSHYTLERRVVVAIEDRGTVLGLRYHYSRLKRWFPQYPPVFLSCWRKSWFPNPSPLSVTIEGSVEAAWWVQTL